MITHIDLTPNNTAAGVALTRQYAAATLKEKSCTRFETCNRTAAPITDAGGNLERSEGI